MATYIKRVRMRGFKSFRHSDIELSPGFVAVAGPNGSGKSNITDAIRFALGEMSLKSLRAKKVADLINHSSSKGEVTLILEGDSPHEIRRAIREDGKTLYRFDGKRATRSMVMEALRPCGYEESGHNIIAQGQVERIIEMNGRERREIIDSVSGIAEFDDKKEEALKNLGSVEQKISDANIVLAERQGFLTQLEKEKDDALKWQDATGTLKRARASLMHHDIKRYDKQFTEVASKLASLNADADKLKADISTLDQRIRELTERRQQLSAKFAKRAEHDAEIRQIEQLKAQLSSDAGALEDKKRETERLSNRLKSLDEEKQKFAKDADALSSELSASQKELSELAKQLGKMERDNRKELQRILGKSIAELRDKLDSSKAALGQKNEEQLKLVSELSALRELISARKDELSRIGNTSAADEGNEKLASEISSLGKDIESLGKEISALWDEERRLNKDIPEHDKRRLTLIDKAANLRAHVAPQAANPALQLISQLKEKSVVAGIHGTVAELVKFEPDYATAIEASAGQRLSYVVVDSIDTASELIEHLKRHKAGRCTFVPIDRQLTPTSADSHGLQSAAGSRGFLIGFVQFDRKFYSAMNYVFGDTLLVENVAAAKKLGIGKARMVTFDGELVERAGIISGGSMRASLAARSQLESLEKEISELDSARSAFYRQLESIREEMGRKRKSRAELEMRLKNCEIERAALLERNKITEGMLANRKKLSDELGEKQHELAEKEKLMQTLVAERTKFAEGERSLSSSIRQEEEKHSAELGELDKNLLEMRSRQAQLSASAEGIEGRRKMLDERLRAVDGERKQLSEDIALLGKEGRELDSKIKQNTKVYKEKEEKCKELSSSIGKILEESNKIDAEISEIGSQRGKLMAQEQQLSREMNDLNVKKATSEQKLVDLKAEFDQFREVPLIDAPKEKLTELINASNEALNTIGPNVNLKAPERYEEERKGIEDIRARVDKLSGEKTAVLSMIEEIETRKSGIFMETFKVVSDNFKTLFNYILPGEAILALENPSDPFNSGLIIKVRSGKHDLHLDAMSGGQKSLIALIFIFSIQMYKSAPFYILDEAEAALDKENSKKLSQLLKQLAKTTQFVVVTHNDATLTGADVVLGVSMTSEGSKIVGIQLTKKQKEAGSSEQQPAAPTSSAAVASASAQASPSASSQAAAETSQVKAQ